MPREDLENAVVAAKLAFVPEEAGTSIMQIAQQAMNENGQKILEMFWQGEEEVCIDSLARWNAQLNGLVELKESVQMRCRK